MLCPELRSREKEIDTGAQLTTGHGIVPPTFGMGLSILINQLQVLTDPVKLTISVIHQNNHMCTQCPSQCNHNTGGCVYRTRLHWIKVVFE